MRHAFLSILLLAIVTLVGCGGDGGGGGSSGGTTPPPTTTPVTFLAVLTNYGHYATPGAFASWADRAVVSDAVTFTTAERPYAEFAIDANGDGISLVDPPRVLLSVFLDPVGGPTSVTAVVTKTSSLWMTGIRSGTMRLPMGGYLTDGSSDPYSGRQVSAGTYTVRIVITPDLNLPAGTPTQTITLPVTILIAPSGAG